MSARKIQDEGEVRRWFAEGRTHAWMQAEYLRKYNIETTMTMFANFRRRRGLDRRIARDDDLIPWHVLKEHRWKNPVLMLRAVARERAGLKNGAQKARALKPWLRSLERDNLVVHYDPETAEGFFYVPRRDGIDLDLIREPDRKTTARKNAG